MWANVSRLVPSGLDRQANLPPDRVFLIHTTPDCPTRPNSVVFAWPPPRIQPFVPLGGLGPLYDGSYWVEDYAELVHQTKLQRSRGNLPWTDANRTSCTQRYQGSHVLHNEGLHRVVESIMIPYGKIIFACFQTKETSLLPPVPAPNATGPFAGLQSQSSNVNLPMFGPESSFGGSRAPPTAESLPPLTATSVASAFGTWPASRHVPPTRSLEAGFGREIAADRNDLTPGRSSTQDHQQVQRRPYSRPSSRRLPSDHGGEMFSSAVSGPGSLWQPEPADPGSVLPYGPSHRTEPAFERSQLGARIFPEPYQVPGPSSSSDRVQGFKGDEGYASSESRPRKRSERETLPSRVAVPPPDGVQCCRECGKTER